MIKKYSLYTFIGIYFCAAATWAFFSFRYYIDSADMLTYLFIAGQYANGNFSDAINSHWSPLISWLFIPFYFSGVNHIVAFHFLQLIVAGSCIVAALLLMRHHKISDFSIGVSSIVLIPFIISLSVLNGTPDLLFLTILLITLLLTYKYPSTKNAIRLSLAGTLLGLSKSFGFVFFFIFIVLHYFIIPAFAKSESENAGRRKKFALIVLTGFIVLSGFWLLALRIKFGFWQISSATAYNFSIMNPAINPDVYAGIKHQHESGNLIAPLGNNLNHWITPWLNNMEVWSPLNSVGSFFHYCKIVIRNIYSFISFYFGKDTGAITLLFALWMGYKNRNGLRSILTFKTEFVAAFVCVLLYMLILIMHRYIWIFDMLLFFIFWKLFDLCIAMQYKVVALFFAVIFSTVLLFFPVLEIVWYKNSGTDVQLAASNFSIEHSKIAAIDSYPEHNDECYTICSAICYNRSNKFYGILGADEIQKNGLKQLREHGVDFLFVFDSRVITQKKTNYGKLHQRFENLRMSVYDIRQSRANF